MKHETFPKTNARPLANSNWQYYATATITCVILVAGFFLAAKQHFSSMEYGLQNSRLRRQVDELESEKRKLTVSREVSLSPVELRKAVRRVGFVDTPQTQIDTFASRDRLVERTVINAVSSKKELTDKPANKVVKTVISAPVTKVAAMDKQARRESSTSQKKDRT